MSFYDRIFNKLVKMFTDKQVEKRYVAAGATVGDALSYGFMGKCVGFDSFVKKWNRWEKEYARRGYRTIIIDAFVSYGGYGKSLKGLGVKRNDGEKPIFHSERFVKTG